MTSKENDSLSITHESGTTTPSQAATNGDIRPLAHAIHYFYCSINLQLIIKRARRFGEYTHCIDARTTHAWRLYLARASIHVTHISMSQFHCSMITLKVISYVGYTVHFQVAI